MKRKWFLASVIMMTALLLPSCAVPSPGTSASTLRATPTTAPLTRLTVCYSAANATQVPVWYALEKGLFEKYGLDVKLLYTDSGSKAAAALIAGEVDLCQVAGASVVNAAVAGADLVMVGSFFNTYEYSMVVRPDITSPQDLKGKAVAISRPGSSSDAAIRAALKQLGLEPDRDVAILAMGDSTARLAAMETGQVAGTLVTAPETLEAKGKGYRELLDMTALGIPFQGLGVATTRRFVAANREVTVNFMKAASEAVSRMKTDKEGTMEVMAKYLLLDPEEAAPSLAEAHRVLVLGYLPQVPYPTLEGIQTLLTSAAAENPEAVNFRPEDVADLSIVKELEDSGFFEELYR